MIDHIFPGIRILKPGINRILVVGKNFVRDQRADRGAAGRVRILIDRYFNSFLSCSFDHRYSFLTPAPVLLPAQFKMRDLYGNFCLTPNSQSFVDGVSHAITFIAHMRGINTIVFGRNFCQLNYLRSFCISTGYINKPR